MRIQVSLIHLKSHLLGYLLLLATIVRIDGWMERERSIFILVVIFVYPVK